MTEQPRRRFIRAPRILSRSGEQVAVRRIRWLLGIYGLLIAIVFAQLISIQVVDADDYADRSLRQRERTIALPAVRGRIYDRDGDVLATSVDGATIYADPRAYRPGETADGTPVPAAAAASEVAATLAPIMDRDPAELEARLEQDAHFVYLGRQLDWSVGEQIDALDLPGVAVLREPKRIYPGSALAAQVVGFTGIDGDGLQGMEAQYDGILRGRPGTLLLERAPGGLDITSGIRELTPSTVGTDLVLTLDRDVQHAAEVAASSAVDGFDANAATVVVLEVATGDVLAMASSPGYDPNAREQDDQDAWRNRAITDVFEPGSTQKALTIAAAIEEGIVTADTTMEVPDQVRVASSTFRDLYPTDEPTMTVGDIMERSSNVGTIQIAQELGDQRLDHYLRAFGYGSPTGSGFPGEASGMLMPHEDWWSTARPPIAIGHGAADSLLQLAGSYATLANDGRSVAPRVIRGTIGDDGRLEPVAARGGQQVVSPTTARQVQQLLERVVSGDRGTGSLAAVPGYTAAGKTGTARKPATDGPGYSDEYVATFAGFAPAHDPEIVVAVMVDEPTPYYGGLVAAPIFREVMEAALIARRVAPDGSATTLPAAMDHARAQALADAEAAQASLDEDPPPHGPAGAPLTPTATETGD